MSKESFKLFARKHQELSKYVLEGKNTWQQFYELYEIYGDNHPIWHTYFTNKLSENNTVNDILDTFKNIDVSSLQKGIENIRKAISILQDIGVNQTKPIYKRFED